ncbi:hypothetical protein [Fructobacillus fructosus]|nr:hypothetical protein [Fructobacillus fructosus]
MGIQELKKNNQYPIIFVGSGISKRYIKNSPDWLSLLKEYWEKLDEDTNFYSFLTKIKEKELNDDNKDDINFIVNAKAASIIQKKFDEKYLLQNNLVPNLTPEKVYREGISPFKFSLSKRFSSLDYLENMSSELKEFTKVIKKSRMVITTNYDCLIEDLIGKNSENIDLFIGGEGFF